MLCCFPRGFTSLSQERSRKGSDHSVNVCAFSCHFLSVGETLLSASIMIFGLYLKGLFQPDDSVIQFSLALLDRGDNSGVFFLESWTVFSACMTQMSFSSFFGQRKASGLVTHHVQQRLQILSAHNDKTHP